MKIYLNKPPDNKIGGGFTFVRNFIKGVQGKAEIVSRWEDCDVFLICGVTIANEGEIKAARLAGKKIVFRVDNVPRKSRNRRSTPHERMKEYAALADVVVYQSEWAKWYCEPLCGDGTVIYNGVDQSVFFPMKSKQNPHRYLFAYHGKNEQKQFWLAHLLFQKEHRLFPEKAEFWFINDFGRELAELQAANFDFWNGENYQHLPLINRSEVMAEILQQCRFLIYPAVADASPNMVLEARACGLEVVGCMDKELSGTAELLDPKLDISLDRMVDEYLDLFGFIHRAGFADL